MSNPFAPPGHQPQPPHGQFAPPAQSQFTPPVQAPPAHPSQGGFAQPVPQDMYAGSGPMWAPQPFAAAPKRGNGLAITAIVMSGLALLAVLGMAAFMAVGTATAPSWVLQGEVTVVDKGVQGPELERALTSIIEDDGSYVGEIACPVRSQVGQGLVSVCHGSVDDWDWTGVVVFEDEAGTFIVNQL